MAGAPRPQRRLSGSLEALLPPSRDHTRLLRACLPSGAAGRGAFTDWRRAAPESAAALRDPEVRRAALLPTLLHAIQHNQADADGELLTVLRVARAHEELRVRTIVAACQEVLDDDADTVLVTGGVALAATVYPDWPLRHCHDLDLLVRDGAGANVHRSGLPVVRHDSLYPAPFDRPAPAPVWERATPAEIAGVPVRVLAPADALIHVLGRAACGTMALRWAIDAWHIADRHPVIDAGVVAAHAEGSRLAAPVAVLARWLVRELDAPLGPGVLDAFEAAARAADPADAALLLRRRRGPRLPRRAAGYAIRSLRRVSARRR